MSDVPGYHWTVKDDNRKWCPSCAKSQPTYCESREGTEECVMGCCVCNRILGTPRIGPHATAASVACAEGNYTKTYLMY